MPEQLTADQQTLARRAADFARDELLVRTPSPGSRDEVIKASKAAGFYTMTQPVEFGGQAASALDLTIVRDELSAHNPPLLDAVFGPGPGVLAGVAEPLATHYLKPLLAGEKRAGFGFTEPEDAQRHTWAELDGDEFVITGGKGYVTGGADADFINTLVDVEGRGKTMIVIDTEATGVTIEQKFASLDGSHHAAFRFDKVRVPTSHAIGGAGQGLPRAMRQIGDTRLMFAAQCIGLMRWTLSYLAENLNSIGRNGKPRGESEVMRLRYADLRIRAYAARSMVYRTARLADRGENIVNEGIACKVFATETIGDIVDEAIQLVGGNALILGHPLEALYRRVRSLRLAEGASDILRVNLSRGKLDLDMGRI
ncbi:MAG: acyl-CoA/acyl-ACP dehydrogenase [Proteobacteria bacterium]|nr:acyl-CoA/acyl-ACP dehydrogenase [Pseudomonadota bacterium]